MMISVSTFRRRLSMAPPAWLARRRPSNVNGYVTTPTVRLPFSLDRRATTGAAPLPVPPPIPAVMNTKSASDTASFNWSRDSSAALSPSSGFPPVPRPRVNLSPICTVFDASELSRACASVFTAQNSTPPRPELIILFTALPPPPPTPMTLMRASSMRRGGRRLSEFSRLHDGASLLFLVCDLRRLLLRRDTRTFDPRVRQAGMRTSVRVVRAHGPPRRLEHELLRVRMAGSVHTALGTARSDGRAADMVAEAQRQP
mmetsp:Transcript_38704/g.74204  ORF Transcript_38704/g.74204 Transcript_38704/m.74204 type:complete len:257 (-) Transcript_38704:16-786(-)